MKVVLCFVPPNGGETDYYLETDLHSIPVAGDYISIVDNTEEIWTKDFIVIRTRWILNTVSNTTNIHIECEFAISWTSSKSHKESCEMYRTRKWVLKEFTESMY